MRHAAEESIIAFTAVGALIAGEAVTTTVVLAAVSEVGLAMTVVGAVTGNKSLMKIGGVMSLVGGVGGMISGAAQGAAGAELSGLEGAVPAGAGSSVGDAALGADYGTQAMSAGSVESSIGGAGPELSSGVGADLAAPTSGMSMPSPSAPPPTNEVAPAVQPNQPAPAVTDVAAQQGNLGNNQLTTPYDRNGSDIMSDNYKGPGPGGFGPPKSSSNFWNSFADFANKNKTLLQGGMQLVGGAMNGANQRDMWDQRMALENRALDMKSYGNQVGQFSPTQGIVSGARA